MLGAGHIELYQNDTVAALPVGWNSEGNVYNIPLINLFPECPEGKTEGMTCKVP